MRPHHNSGAFLVLKIENLRFYGSNRKTLADVSGYLAPQISKLSRETQLIVSVDLQLEAECQSRLRVGPKLLVKLGRIMQIAGFSSFLDRFKLGDFAFEHEQAASDLRNQGVGFYHNLSWGLSWVR